MMGNSMKLALDLLRSVRTSGVRTQRHRLRVTRLLFCSLVAHVMECFEICIFNTYVEKVPCFFIGRS